MDAERRTEGDDGITRRRLLCGAAGGALAGLAGCIVHGEESDISGTVHVDGSNTVLPHAAAVAGEFGWRNNQVDVPVRGSGTGAGFQQFCIGSTDVQNASRPIDEENEVPLCEEHDVEWVNIEIALDGIAVYKNPENDWCDCLTVEELNRIWDPETTVETWSDVRAEWPDVELVRYGRDRASGTFDYFTEQINGAAGAMTSDYSPSADTNVIIRGVEGNLGAIGFGGASYYHENPDTVELVGVDDGTGCVRPTTGTVEGESYTPLTRPLFAYFRRDSLAREEVRAYAEFYFEAIDDQAREVDFVTDGETLAWTQWGARAVGFYGLPDDRLEESRATLEAALSEVSE
ncbi:PstS family phosphate ABC transporter substrate-binding protein [Natronobiforma cellulositropha]|uniref:PstS family phosphate ABC transporter substrate-binding protein n=1 Tax=Natronobiforma cellulositropha TaxID=1679076 RepID=UPI0021D589FF|nr:PstS family phosphate ABC transporter substrate-binding protein [Natronobiforma cellulositropha]